MSATQTSVRLSWNAAIDNVGVAGYSVYRSGTKVADTTATSHTVTGLSCGTGYSFSVDAFDAAGNRSGQASATASTAACSPGGLGSALPAPFPLSTGTTYYVATTGSDSNPGTFAAPWRTVQKALNTLTAGQKAQVRAGTYTQNLRMSRAGSAAAPITLENYPGERPILASGGGHALEVASDAAYFRLRGFIVQGFPGVSGGNIDIYGDHIEISGNEIRQSNNHGIYTEDDSSSFIHILGNWIHGNGVGRTSGQQAHGIYFQGTDHLAANNVIHDHPWGFGIQVYDENHRSIIVNNTITDSGHSGIVVGGSGGVSDITIRNNVIAHNDHNGISFDSTCPTSGIAIDHNVLFGNGWSPPIENRCTSAVNTAGGNAFGNPLFVDYAARNLHLQAGSPALGYALPAWSPLSDHDGQARPQGAGPDAGAYER
jgi:chitodextrinase